MNVKVFVMPNSVRHLTDNVFRIIGEPLKRVQGDSFFYKRISLGSTCTAAGKVIIGETLKRVQRDSFFTKGFQMVLTVL